MEHVRARATRYPLAVLAALLIVLAAPAVASADVLTVNTTADDFDEVCSAPPGDCTLREAVDASQSGDVISVPAGTYVLDPQQGGELLIDESVSLIGAGARETIISGAGQSRVIYAHHQGNGSSITISAVTLTAGNGVGEISTGGGAVYVQPLTTLALSNSAVTGSTAPMGGGVFNDGRLLLSGTTVSSNQAAAGDGGGIYHGGAEPSDLAFVARSTVSGNNASGAGGGIYASGGTLNIAQTTIANNVAATVSGLYKATGATQIADTIVAGSNGAACAGPTGLFSGTNNLATDTTCAVAAVGNPLIGPLANNGGPTNTHALAATSPAINTASPAADRCTGTDQRGVARPQGAACDIGAYEYRAPVLTVVTTVVNDHGFNDVPSDFTVRVGASAAPGSAGTPYALVPGTHVVSADARRGYTFAYGGACAPSGSVTIGEGGTAVCTVTANDPSPTPGQEVNALPARGTVRVKLAGKKWRRLREGEQLPMGTRIDTLKGRVTLLAAGGQRMTFYDGIFKIASQTKGSKPLTTLTLTEKLSCKRSSANQATTAAKRKTKRRLWGNGSGRFRTKGKHSAATVVGTKWLVEDRCTSTLTKVVRGKVKVRDFAKKKTITLRKGKRYIARAKR